MPPPPPGPTAFQFFRHYLGRCIRETGQMFDRVGLRGEAASGSWKSNKATRIMSSSDPSKIDSLNWAAHQEPWLFDTPLSRHRTMMPVFRAGQPRISTDEPTMSVVEGTTPFIAPCSTLVGDVTVHQGASIWYGAVIRGDTHIKKEKIGLDKESDEEVHIGVVIGEGTNVQDNAIISGCPYTGLGVRIGKGVTVGHSASIVGATVGDNVLVGMGSTISAGAVVESGSFLAAGTVVRGGQVVKSGELWAGQPARKLKDLTEKQKKQLFYQADEYVKLSQRHAHTMELGGEEDEEVLRMNGVDVGDVKTIDDGKK
ncbi:hypothetical protein TrST_g7388 [Triparma strigata]|uniref:Uncharacterized protein n=1 Tax=Triparma strigata TaxID=1606541 RepID=A0A9W7ABH0_9STRA|nr:hypothetical protein TrST_g7388 [Triparma strigata]